MPRAFTEQERAAIQDRLLDAGREYFMRYGIRRTNVEDLTRAAGISKGAFYLFFDSKEELFMQILEAYEAEQREQIFAYVLDPELTSRRNLASLLRQALLIWEEGSFLRNFSQEDFEALRRGLTAERARQHSEADEAFIAQVLARWQGSGEPLRRDPRIVSGLMKALFFLGLHREDFDPATYSATMQVLTDLVAGYLVAGEIRPGDISPDENRIAEG